jgi:hypothetical protein
MVAQAAVQQHTQSLAVELQDKGLEVLQEPQEMVVLLVAEVVLEVFLQVQH